MRKRKTVALILLTLTILLSYLNVPHAINAASTTYSCEYVNTGIFNECIPISTDCNAINCNFPVPNSCTGIGDIALCKLTSGNCDCVAPNPQIGCPAGSINSAIGCIPTQDTTAFTLFLLTWGIGIGGGVAFLLIVFASIQIMTASGDPAKVQAGKGLFTAALTGLLFAIFSVFILRLVGSDILNIPGL